MTRVCCALTTDGVRARNCGGGLSSGNTRTSGGDCGDDDDDDDAGAGAVRRGEG